MHQSPDEAPGFALAASVAWDTDRHCWSDLVDQPTQEIYQAYERRLGVGHRPALLAIDLYALAFAGGDHHPATLQEHHPSSCGQFAHAARPALATTFTVCRELTMPVLHTTAAENGRATNRSTTEPQSLYEFDPQCQPEVDEPIIRKERASGFFGTALAHRLIENRIDTVIVIGQSTSGCVRATAVDAYSYGFHVVIVEDAVFDRSPASHVHSLFDLHHKYADVVSVSTLVRLLQDGSCAM
jgi:maleamate amidohydrolase